MFVAKRALGGTGDVASAVKLSRSLRRHGATVTVYLDTEDFTGLESLLGEAAPLAPVDVYRDGGRGPIACEAASVDGTRWIAAARDGRQSAYGWSAMDVLVCLHDIPVRPDIVSCPVLLVHEYGDHDPRWKDLLGHTRAIDYRTGLVVDPRQPGDVVGGVYMTPGAGAPASRMSRRETVTRILDRLRDSRSPESDPPGEQSARAELLAIVEAAAAVAVYYVGRRQGSEGFVTAWARARGDARALPVLFAVRKRAAALTDALRAVPHVLFVADASGRLERREGATHGEPRVCVVCFEAGVPSADFERLLMAANDVSLLTGDHSITEALAVAHAGTEEGRGPLPLLYVGYYEKVEDYGDFLGEFDARLAAAYVGWVIERVDGRGDRTPRASERLAALVGACPPPLDAVFSPEAAARLRQAVAVFPAWLRESRRGRVAGRDAVCIARSFPRAVAHVANGHNVDDLKATAPVGRR